MNITISEAAKELGVRKGQAIELADAGTLKYVCDGSKGKVKTVTLDSVWVAKKMDREQMLATIRKAPKTSQEESGSPGDMSECPIPLADVRTCFRVLLEIRNEIRQVKGILCDRLRAPMQDNLPGM